MASGPYIRGKSATRITRRFNGKPFHYSNSAFNKAEAQERAAHLKRRGFLVRTTHNARNVYELWARKKTD